MASNFRVRKYSSRIALLFQKKSLATVLAILFHLGRAHETRRAMRQARTFTLHGPAGRKYLTARERRRFSRAADDAPAKIRLFCIVLACSGGRVSETLALTPAAIDLDIGAASIETLKRRARGVIRQVPLPRSVVRELELEFDLRGAQRDPLRARCRLWPWSRTTAWRRIKSVMVAADIHGACAMPKGLRHAFGVNAFQAKVPPHLIQRWLGHASFRTTAIYGDVMGPEERSIAARMWRS
jgi:integrase/recombinase XerD